MNSIDYYEDIYENSENLSKVTPVYGRFYLYFDVKMKGKNTLHDGVTISIGDMSQMYDVIMYVNIYLVIAYDCI